MNDQKTEEIEEIEEIKDEPRVVSGDDAKAHAEHVARLRMQDPWYAVAEQCPHLIGHLLGAIDVQARFGPHLRTVEVPTGEMDAGGHPILREVEIAEPDADRVEALAAAACDLIEVHDYAMRRRSKQPGRKGKH